MIGRAPGMERATVSVTVSDCVPAVSRVALKVPTPAVSVLLAGSTALASLLLKVTVPAYAGVRLPNASSAVTVNVPATPAVAGDGKPVTANWDVAVGVTS